MNIRASLRIFLILLSLFLLTTGLLAAPSKPFFLHYDVICPQNLGSGLNGELLLSITNITDNMLKDIMISLPTNSTIQFGTNSHSQVGNLPAGGHVLIKEHLFDPKDVSQTGSMVFIIDFTDDMGQRQCAEVTAVGSGGGAQ